MNLVLSGPIDDSLRNLVVALTRPRRVVRLHDRADRLEGAADDPSVRAEVAALCEAARVDHAYIEEGITFADFKLMAMDMDSTLITIECIDEIADYAGKKAEVSAITEAAMRGEIDFAESLKQRVATLAAIPCKGLSDTYGRAALTPGVHDLLHAAKMRGIYTILISGGFTYFAARLADELAIDEVHANTLEVADNTLTGRLTGTLIDGRQKAAILTEALRRFDSSSSLAIGDGANDIPMMLAATQSVAYHAKPNVRRAASSSVEFGNLTVVLDYFAQ